MSPKPTLQKAKQSVAYVRTSTKANKDRGGKARALRCTAAAAESKRDIIEKVVHDIVSGTVGLEKRSKFKSLLQKGNHIYAGGASVTSLGASWLGRAFTRLHVATVLRSICLAAGGPSHTSARRRHPK